MFGRMNQVQMEAAWSKRVDKERDHAQKAVAKLSETKSRLTSKQSTANPMLFYPGGGNGPKIARTYESVYPPPDPSRPKRAFLPGGLNHTTPPAPEPPTGKMMLKGAKLPSEYHQALGKVPATAAGKPSDCCKDGVSSTCSRHGGDKFKNYAAASAATSARSRTRPGALGATASLSDFGSTAGRSATSNKKDQKEPLSSISHASGTAPAVTQDQLLRSIANIEQDGTLPAASGAASRRSDNKSASRRSSSRWRGSFAPDEDGASSVPGSAGEAQFHEEIRSVVEQEVSKLLAPLEKELQAEREKRQKAEMLLTKVGKVKPAENAGKPASASSVKKSK
ncbi:unnamed protein product [Amoebophrya sp. A25]|nr:unnamed protein product [Amoebophrya sp. A25]|eukprot:GSA25T00022560001.1